MKFPIDDRTRSASFVIVLSAFLWSQISNVEAAEIDDLHSEIVAIEIFVADYEIVFKNEIADAIPGRIESALIAAGPSVSTIRDNSNKLLKDSYTEFCLTLDNSRDAQSLAAEIDGLTIDSLRGRKKLIEQSLASAGLDADEVEVVKRLAWLSVGQRIVSSGPSASSLSSAQQDPDAFKKVLSTGCTSHLDDDYQEPTSISDADRSFTKKQ